MSYAAASSCLHGFVRTPHSFIDKKDEKNKIIMRRKRTSTFLSRL